MIVYMEKKHIQRFDQHEELYFDKYIDWSITFYEDDLSSEEEGPTEPIAKHIVGRKRKRSPKEQPYQQLVKDLIINVKQKNPAQPSIEQHNLKELIIDEAFNNIHIPKYVVYITTQKYLIPVISELVSRYFSSS